MADSSAYRGKSKDELLAAFVELGPVSGARYDQVRAALASTYAEEALVEVRALTAAIDRANESSGRLARVGIGLNVVLVVATAVIAWGTYLLAIPQ